MCIVRPSLEPHEWQETSIHGCVAAFHLKVVVDESNFCLKKIYKAS